MNASLKKTFVGFAAVAGLALAGCMSGGSNPSSANSDEFGTVVILTKASSVQNLSRPGLGKSAVIELDSLYIRAISNASTPDTVTLSYAVGDSVGNGVFVSAVDADQELNVEVPLRALRTWYLSVWTKDVNDSTVHTGADTVENLLAGQFRLVNLDASPLFTMYTAKFNFPDSIFSPSGLFGQKINLSKIELLVDGDVVADSVATFADSTDYVLAYDYVVSSNDSITLNVFGTLQGADEPWDTESLLYTRTVAISSLSVGGSNEVALTWEGPAGGALDLNVTIQEVGVVDIDAETPHEVLD